MIEVKTKLELIITSESEYSYLLTRGRKTKKIHSQNVGSFNNFQSEKIDINYNDLTFVNGYALTTYENKYIFIEEGTNKIMPYNYEYATNFNAQGYAMVCRNQNITWINKEFKALNAETNKFAQDTGELTGFQKIESFKEYAEDVNLSKLYYKDNIHSSYLKRDGCMLRFESVDKMGEAITKFINDNMTPWGKKGYMTDKKEGTIYLSNGTYYTFEDSLELMFNPDKASKVLMK